MRVILAGLLRITILRYELCNSYKKETVRFISSWFCKEFWILIGSLVLIISWVLRDSLVLIRSWVLRVLGPRKVLGPHRVLGRHRILHPCRVLGPRSSQGLESLFSGTVCHLIYLVKSLWLAKWALLPLENVWQMFTF